MRGKLIVLGLLALAVGGIVKVAKGHDIYSDWTMPDAPSVSCCHGTDCRPVTATLLDNGLWLVKTDGLEVIVPKAKVMSRPSPDGRSHWCGQGVMTYCFLPGEIRI